MGAFKSEAFVLGAVATPDFPTNNYCGAAHLVFTPSRVSDIIERTISNALLSLPQETPPQSFVQSQDIDFFAPRSFAFSRFDLSYTSHIRFRQILISLKGMAGSYESKLEAGFVKTATQSHNESQSALGFSRLSDGRGVLPPQQETS